MYTAAFLPRIQLPLFLNDYQKRQSWPAWYTSTSKVSKSKIHI